ncbi:IS66 family insertion sequence element accessory protein TnpA [Ruminococcus flavefaciens]|uniref:IS66 family insertion sequence element accessory protein TnpA n=1 Tax=Ruminococcus flavefaciens TaxID=1265 RepID=UPI0004902CCE|nr:hypothetical protein [Ruminococcus flavefaciens]
MATIKEVKRELRYRKWAEEIAECQSSGMKIKEWCRMKGISCNTYYRRLRVVRTALIEQTTNTIQPIVPLSSSAALQRSEPETIQPIPVCEKVMIRKNGIEIELPQEVSETMLLTLLRGLREC